MPKLVPGIVLGRRFCTGECGRWRYICDFSPRKWNEDGTLKYTSSECRVCKRRRENARWRNASAITKRRRNNSSRAHYRRRRRQDGVKEIGARVVNRHQTGSVRREPFAAWLREKRDVVGGVGKLADIIGLSPRQIHSYLNGYDGGGRRVGGKKRKLRQVDYVQLVTVDDALMMWGESPVKLNELYPAESASDTP